MIYITDDDDRIEITKAVRNPWLYLLLSKTDMTEYEEYALWLTKDEAILLAGALLSEALKLDD